MFRTLAVVASIIVILVLAPRQTQSQASKQLDERAKKVATSQEQSWKQVDEINKQTDNTKSRYQQAQKSNVKPSQTSGYRVMKSTAGSPYKKSPPPKHKATPKKK